MTSRMNPTKNIRALWTLGRTEPPPRGDSVRQSNKHLGAPATYNPASVICYSQAKHVFQVFSYTPTESGVVRWLVRRGISQKA